MVLRANLDARQIDTDWLRARAWDLPIDPDQFLMAVSDVEHFMTLPAAQAMPESLRAALRARGYKHLPGQHDQEDHGNRSGVDRQEAEMLSESAASGGFSYQPFANTAPTTGFMVGGLVEPTTIKVGTDRAAMARAIVAYAESHRETLKSDPSMFLGGWVYEGDLVLELAENIKDRDAAEAAGRDRNQIAIWDVEGTAEVQTGGSGEFSKSTGAAGLREDPRQLGRDDWRREGEVGAGGRGRDHQLSADSKHLDGQHDQTDHGNRGGGVGDTPSGGEGRVPPGGVTTSQGYVPPSPADIEVPPGKVLVFHVTNLENLDSIKENGLTVARARGEEYGEPNQIWATVGTNSPQAQAVLDGTLADSQRLVVAWLVTPTDEDLDIGSAGGMRSAEEQAESLNARSSDVTMRHDVPASELYIYEPWQAGYIFMRDSEYSDEYLKLGEDFWPEGSGWGRAIRALEGKAKHFPGQHDQEDHGAWATGSAAGTEKESEPQGTLSVSQAHLGDLNQPSRDRWTGIMESRGLTPGPLEAEILSKIAVGDYQEVLKAIADGEKVELNEELVRQASGWYQGAHDLSKSISEESGLPQEKIAAALSIMSARCKWEDEETGEGETKYVRDLANFYAEHHEEFTDPKEAILAWKADYKETEGIGASVMNSFSEKAWEVFDDQKSLEEAMGDNKQRSFFNNIMEPGETSEVTVDTHMFKALENAYDLSVTGVDAFAKESTQKLKDDISVQGVGYIAVAQATREIADKYGLSPDAVQAAYWLAVKDSPHIQDPEPVMIDGKPKIPIEWPSGDITYVAAPKSKE